MKLAALTLEDWVTTKEWSHGDSRYPRLYSSTRTRTLTIGLAHVAWITDYTMARTGIHQYTVGWLGGPRPPQKFDSFQQASDYLERIISE